jgi:hypothetical protein
VSLTKLPLPLKVTLRMKQQVQPVIPAPDWLVRRMENLRRMPPPSLEEVRRQMRASAEQRRKSSAKLAA